MEKEICILKNFRNILDATTDTDCTDLDNAIKTIEYAMKPKTCSSCYFWNDFYAKCNDHDNSLAGVDGYGCNRYEPKEQ